ncbi:ribonuclease P protein subunit p21 isoform X1 [Mustela nigripes]|uniref:Ribonuclease P/MRP subunit p21 n=1 Tax=Mustela putorius furo TaxID=9669 RepID=M3YK84_MUSPF|nr:ribonuclease P protein subunit p21 isoform X1 [Mustela lutreola]XP_059255708.1 ribonuclease P protein subunit p21 isoform X1 [Mustela nigripes]
MAGPVKDREAFQRLSFLYQAAHCVLAQDPMNQALARFYCYTERTIAKRLVLRRDPSVKRTLCRGCSSLLIPGLTCTQRQRRCRGQRWTVQTCLTCQRSQRFLNDPDHLLWGDRPEAQLGSQAVIYTEHGTRTYNPKIKSHMLLRLSRPVKSLLGCLVTQLHICLLVRSGSWAPGINRAGSLLLPPHCLLLHLLVLSPSHK